MALDILAVFRALTAAREGFLVASGQADKYSAFNQLVTQTNINPAWYATLAQTYDSLIRVDSSGMGSWSQVAQTILQQLIAAEDPYYGTSIDTALQYLHTQMLAQSKTVKRCVVGSTVTADAANVGTGVVFVTLVRADGVPLENTVAEETTLLITADSYTGGATAGQEPWQWNGTQNLSSRGTGVPVGVWDYDSPQGSGAGAGGSCVSAAEDANTAGNLLTNGDFEDWDTAGTPFLDYWHLTSGTWGTDIRRSTTALGGTYSVSFVAGGASVKLTQQFDTDVSDGADGDAGTTAAIVPLTGFALNVWLKASGPATGTLRFTLEDDGAAVIDDQSGTPNEFDVDLSDLTVNWTAFNVSFRTPVVLPAVIRLCVSTPSPPAGANVFMDDVCLVMQGGGLVNLYPGGPNVAVFSNPATPFEAAPDPDGFTLTFANDRGGATYGATWQFDLFRLFGQPFFLAPSAATPNIPDSLITGGVPRLAAYYPMTGQPAGLLSDASGNARDLTASSPVYDAGKFWSALIGGTQTYTGTFAYTTLSLSLWFKFLSTASASAASFTVVTSGPATIFGFTVERNTATLTVTRNGSTAYSQAGMATDVWHHAVVSFDGTSTRVFVDGSQVFVDATAPTGTVATINLTGTAKAAVADAAVFIDALTAAEVQALYSGGADGGGRPALPPYPW